MADRRKSVLITGASKGGIGDALAREFHNRDVRVFATVRDESKAEDLAQMGIEVLKLDVMDQDAVKEAIKTISQRTNGRLDILINNAGFICNAPLLDVNLDDARSCLETNIIAVISVTQACFPLLKATRGNIINIGSISAEMPFIFSGIYGSSKSALAMISRVLRVELEPFHVSVTHIVAGYIYSNVFNKAVRREIQPSSPYYEARTALEPILNVDYPPEKVLKPTSAEAFAVDVANNALKPQPQPRLWLAAGANITWIFSRFIPESLFGWLYDVSGFPTVRAAMKGKEW